MPKTLKNNEKIDKRKIVLLARNKLNSIENIISKALTDNEISPEDLTTIMNEERNYRELNESIRMIKSQRSDIKRNRLMEDDKRKGIDKIIRQNERINE